MKPPVLFAHEAGRGDFFSGDHIVARRDALEIIEATKAALAAFAGFLALIGQVPVRGPDSVDQTVESDNNSMGS
jgi:hypothetical protein